MKHAYNIIPFRSFQFQLSENEALLSYNCDGLSITAASKGISSVNFYHSESEMNEELSKLNRFMDDNSAFEFLCPSGVLSISNKEINM